MNTIKFKELEEKVKRFCNWPINFIEQREITAFRFAIILSGFFLVISVFVYFVYSVFLPFLLPFLLPLIKRFFGDFVVNDPYVYRIGIQALIGLLAVVAMAGLAYLYRIKPSKWGIESSNGGDGGIQTGIIRLLRIIIAFIFIFFFLGFLEHIELLAIQIVIAIAGLTCFCLIYDICHKCKDKDRDQTEIIRLLCILGFIFILSLICSFWGFFEHISINLFIFISLSGLLYMTACYLKKPFRG